MWKVPPSWPDFLPHATKRRMEELLGKQWRFKIFRALGGKSDTCTFAPNLVPFACYLHDALLVLVPANVAHYEFKLCIEAHGDTDESLWRGGFWKVMAFFAYWGVLAYWKLKHWRE